MTHNTYIQNIIILEEYHMNYSFRTQCTLFLVSVATINIVPRVLPFYTEVIT